MVSSTILHSCIVFSMNSQKMNKKEIKLKLGLSDENFSFYLLQGLIIEVGKYKFTYELRMEKMYLERSTVYKYSFEDSFLKDLDTFIDSLKYSGNIREYSKKEIQQFIKDRDKEK